MKGQVFEPKDLNESRYHCRYLVVGSGAGGSTAAVLLAEAGEDVIILEEGHYFKREDFKPNVAESTSKMYRNQGVFPFLGAPSIAFAEGQCVGGGTVINGGLWWRTPPWILEEWEQKHGVKGYSPDEMLPHFEAVEKDLNVHRHTLEDDVNLDSLAIWNGAQELGWKAVMVPRALKNCINENWCPTGCIAGGKQSMIETYIPRSLNAGAKLFTHCRAKRILHNKGRAHELIATVKGENGSKEIRISFEHIIIACGTIQSAHLIKRSKMSRLAGGNFQFHINLKIIALHDKDLQGEKGTIFTVQVQEYEEEGLLIMPSNLKPHYVAMTGSHFGDDTVNYLLDNYDRSAIHVAMIRPDSKGHIFSGFGDQPFVWYRFDKRDIPKIIKALEKACEVLFASGAQELYLPVRGTGPIRRMEDLETLNAKLKTGLLEMISVHSMSSCPMGPDPKTSVTSLDGRLHHFDNVWLGDAAMLPSNIGESPQGTIQAMVRKVVGGMVG